MKQFLKLLAKNFLHQVFVRHFFLTVVLICILAHEWGAALINAMFAFYFKLDDIQTTLEKDDDIVSITINAPAVTEGQK